MKDVEIALLGMGVFVVVLFIIAVLCVWPPCNLWKGLFHRDPHAAPAFHNDDLEVLQPNPEQERDSPMDSSR